jgi:hypothetical protein
MTRITDASGSSEAIRTGGANRSNRVQSAADSTLESAGSSEPGNANAKAPIVPLSPGGEKLLNAVQALVADVNSIIFALDVLEKGLKPRLTESFRSLIDFFENTDLNYKSNV